MVNINFGIERALFSYFIGNYQLKFMYENQSSHNEILVLPSKWWLIDQNVLLLKKQSLRLTWICAHTFQRTAPWASSFFFSEPSCHVHDCVLGHSSFSTLPCFDLPNQRQRLTFYNSSTARMAKGGPPQVEVLCRVEFLTEFSFTHLFKLSSFLSALYMHMMHGGKCFRTLLLLFWWYWGLNSEPRTCWSSTLPLSDFPSLAVAHYILMPNQIELPVRTQNHAADGRHGW